MNPDTIGCVWTGEFDLNTLRVDGDFFESGKKNLRIQKYPDTCGRGLSILYCFISFSLVYVSSIYCIFLFVFHCPPRLAFATCGLV